MPSSSARDLGAELYGTMFLAPIFIQRGRIDEAAAMVEPVILPGHGEKCGDHAGNPWTCADCRGRTNRALGSARRRRSESHRRPRLEHRDQLGPVGRRRAGFARRREQAVEIASRELAEASAFGRDAHGRDCTPRYAAASSPDRPGSPSCARRSRSSSAPRPAGPRAGAGEPWRGTARPGRARAGTPRALARPRHRLEVRRDRARRAGQIRDDPRRRSPTPGAADRTGFAHARRAARRPHGGRWTQQPRNRPGAVRLRQDDRDLSSRRRTPSSRSRAGTSSAAPWRRWPPPAERPREAGIR